MPITFIRLLILFSLSLLATDLLAAPVNTLSQQQKDSQADKLIINPPSQLGAGEAFLTTMIADPSVESATFHVDGLSDPTINSSKIPLQFQHPLTDSNLTLISRFKVGHMTVQQDAITTPWNGSIDPSWKGSTITAGIGINIPLSEHWSVLPSFDLGAAKFKNKTRFYGDINQELLQPAFDELALTNWESQATLISGALALNYQRQFGKTDVETRFLYALSTVKTFDESRNLRAFDEQVDSAAIRLNMKHPLGLSPFNTPLTGVLLLGGNSFVGGDRNALGFHSYAEVGAALIFDISGHQQLLENISLGGKLLFGEGVDGWAIVLDYNL